MLQQLYQNLVIPPAVAREWGTRCAPWMTIQAVQNQTLVQALRLQLGPGEAEAIALSIESGADRLILDDQHARRIAAQLQVPITGTIGVVQRAKQRALQFPTLCCSNRYCLPASKRRMRRKTIQARCE